MWEYIIDIDTQLLIWLNAFNHWFWDGFMTLATNKYVWSGFYLAIAFALWKSFGWKSMLIIFVGCVVGVAISDQFTASLLRPYFERLRPSNINNPVSELLHLIEGYRGGKYGFPSSHASNTFTIFTIISLVFKRWQVVVGFLLWALLNCYSRIYLGVHYPLDLLVGASIGVLVGIFLFYIISITNSSLGSCKNLERGGTLQSFHIFGWHGKYYPYQVMLLIEGLTILTIAIIPLF